MKRINVILLVAALWIFAMGWLSHRALQAPILINPNIYHENDSLKSEVLSKDSVIFDLETQIDILKDEIQLREGEISYWGQKYDSISRK